MTEEQEIAYSVWVVIYGSKTVLPVPSKAFAAGWDAHAARTSDIARQNERDAIEKKLLTMAGDAFIANRDDHAHWFRALVNTLFKKPGDPSV